MTQRSEIQLDILLGVVQKLLLTQSNNMRLRIDHLFMINELDLIAKEFKYHDTGYDHFRKP